MNHLISSRKYISNSYLLLSTFITLSLAAPYSVSAEQLMPTESKQVEIIVPTKPELKSEVELNVITESSVFRRINAECSEAMPKQGKVKSLGKRVGQKAASLANFVIDARGFDFSKEGADLILGCNKFKNNDSQEFNYREQKDQKELQVTELTMQLASVMDRDKTKTDKVRAELNLLLGEQEANKIFEEISAIQVTNLPPNEKIVWELDERNIKLKSILEASAKNDKVLNELTKRLYKYNHRSKAMQVLAKITYTGLGITAFTPTLVAPISEASILAFMYATGGPEQDKLLNELYLSKMMQSRCNVLNEKAHLITSSLDLAALTQNKKLYACTKLLLESMTNQEISQNLLEKNTNSIVIKNTDTLTN